MSKPRVAIFDFAGCEGDQLQIVNLEEAVLDVLGQVEIVTWREAMKEQSDHYDIALVEGSITRKSDEERIKAIRGKAGILVAIGACATIGGINCMKNFQDEKFVRRYVYGDKAHWYNTYAARPVSAVVSVDANVHGCPINREEFVQVLKALLQGKKPFIPNYPMCVDCKKAGNVCVLLKGQFCMGPVTRAGCGACCITEGAYCSGCRGLVDDPNMDAARALLGRFGISAGEALGQIRLYDGYREEAR
ncbi:MAG: hypothetical protein PHT49_07165 [Desulfovibrionales bacterium]|nr:hypothetical protein [Desulfovibrionales bacterium]